MFTSRRITHLHRRLEAVTEERDEARRDACAALSSMTTMAGHADLDHRRYAGALSRYQQRLARLAYAVVRLRRELTAADRRCQALQARLDMAVGLDDPGIALGTEWQQRRTDKTTTTTPKGGR